MILGRLRGLLARKFPSLREAAANLGRSHNFLNSVLSGRTQLKLSALLRILRVGDSSLPALNIESQHETASPLGVLRHFSHQQGEDPRWLRRWRDGFFREARNRQNAECLFDTADYELRLYSSAEELRDELDHILLHAVAAPLESRPVLAVTWIRLALLWCRAESSLSPGAQHVPRVLEALDRQARNDPSLAWMRPEILLAAAHCIADVAQPAVGAAIQEVVHSAVVEDQAVPLVGALLFDAEVALWNSEGQRADRILRSLARHLKSLSESESLSDSRVFPIQSSPCMFWLTKSPSHGARLLLASAWRHWLLGDYSRALGELDELSKSIRHGMDSSGPFQAQAAWLRAVVARDTGQLPAMVQYLGEAAQLDLEQSPIRSTLAQLRRMAYFWETGQRQQFRNGIHHDLGSAADRMDDVLAAQVLRLRAQFSRGDLAEKDLNYVESVLAEAVERPGPWA